MLPYASINERRDRWRKDFHTRFSPLVKGSKTLEEAAQILNKEIWKIINVRYHARKRPKPDQSPYESMDAGFASCTGLSVLLIDACRSVGVPSRFVGTPMWANKRGNHSWVEVWDGNSWQFTGACEYSAAGLGNAWFKGSASKAIKEDPKHAIYAASWKRTKTNFPLIGLLTEWQTNSGLEKRNKNSNLGGTMRLGAYDCNLIDGSFVKNIYKKNIISERHRHRFEVNNKFNLDFKKNGLIFSGMSPDNALPEILEIPLHPWFVGVQFHPELKSRPFDPHPLFSSFINASLSQSRLL